MISEETAKDFFRQEYRAFVPHHTVDCVVFGFHGGELRILLLKWKHLGAWSLPGGPIHRSETLDEAARRVLKDRTGLDRVFLQQFHTFGDLDRREHAVAELIERLGVTTDDGFWLVDRVISTGYYALVDFSTVAPTPDFFSEECVWCDVHDHPALLFDHDRMVDRALRTLRRQLSHQPVGLNLLPETFTMPELRRLYETILGRELDRRNFQKKILSLGLVERLEKRRTGGAHRPPYLYRFDLEKYERALEHGLSAGF